MSKAKQRDAEKERHWQKVIREGTRSGMSIREFCRRRGISEWQFYSWQRKLRGRRGARALRRGGRGKAGGQGMTFALVSEEPGELDAGIELVVADGRRIRIRRGVDEETLRTVLSAMGAEG